MRSAIGAFGVAGALVLIAWVSRYGYKTAETEADALMSAFMFGFVTAGALCGHAIGARCWRFSRALALAWLIFAFVALALSLSNSLGAIVNRSAGQHMAAIEHNRKIEAAQLELRRLEAERGTMPAFTWVSAEAVSAAQTALSNASTAKNAECGNGDAKQRGNNCRARETAEAAASLALTDATRNRASTAKAEQLEAGAAAERVKLQTLGARLAVNQQGSAIARLFRMPDSEAGFAATVQQFGMAVSVEVMIMLLMLAWEAMGRDGTLRATSHPAIQETAASEPAKPAETKIRPSAPKKLALVAPAKPKLVTSTASPVGPVKRILTDLLETSSGDKLEIAELATAYKAACKAQGRRAASMETFLDEVETFCKALGLKRKTIKGHVYLMDVKLGAAEDKAAES
jgi:hypothetical protein